MEKPKITHILAGTATISLPILVLLIFLVGIEELAFSSAIIAGFIGIITCIIIITLQTLRIKKIQNFVEKDLVLKIQTKFSLVNQTLLRLLPKYKLNLHYGNIK